MQFFRFSSSGDNGSDAGRWEGELVYTIEAFMDTRGLPPPIVADPSSEFETGNVNIYTDTMLWELDAIGASALIGLVQGTCVRTDVNPMSTPAYEGRGWCTLTFEALIGTDQGQEVVASFSAEGTVLNHNNTEFETSVLTITGGLGQFNGISGEIYLDTAVLNTDVIPPKAVYDPEIDFLSSPDGYIVFGFLYSDVRIDILETVMDDAMLVDDFIIDDTMTMDPTATDEPSATFEPTFLVDDGMMGETVLCPGVSQENFCDCTSDCINEPDTRCGCTQAQSCCEASGFA